MSHKKRPWVGSRNKKGRWLLPVNSEEVSYKTAHKYKIQLMKMKILTDRGSYQLQEVAYKYAI